MSDIKSINTKHKPSCNKEEEKIIVNVNCAHENHCENGSHHNHEHSDILNAISTTECNILGAISTCCDNTQAGISNVTSIVESLYINPCLIKSLARIAGAMTPLYINCDEMECYNGTDCGVFRDPLTSTEFKFLNDCYCKSPSGPSEIFIWNAQQSMFDFITDPSSWTCFTC